MAFPHAVITCYYLYMMKKENPINITTTVPLAAYVGIGIAVFCWGISFASMRIVVSELNPLVGVWARILLGMPVLLFAVLRRNELRSPSKKEWPILLFMGFLGILWHQGIQFWGMRTAGVANANWMIAGTPALVALMGWFFLKEKLSTSGIVGLGISAFGVLIVVGLGTQGSNLFKHSGSSRLGDFLMILSSFNWALFQILSRKLTLQMRPAFAIFWLNAIALCLGTLLIIGNPMALTELFSLSPKAWGALLFLGVVCSGLCYVLWYDGLAVLSAARVTAFQFFQPLVGAAAAYIMIGERFTWYLPIGGTMILFGVWLINRQKKK